MKYPRVRSALVLSVIGAMFSVGLSQDLNTGSASGAVQNVLCRALEVKIDSKTGATVVLFHQANKADGPALGELLKSNEGANVEFVTSDGKPHTATLFRLDTCFGRGLLVFPAAVAHVRPHEQFSLRIAGRSS